MDIVPDGPGRAIDYSATYTVILRGESFELTHDQLLRDSPNFFTGCFLSDFREADSRVVRLSRNPALFRILLEYMSGYEILPLNPAALPATMPAEIALQNLLADCEFYGLDGLIPRLQEILSPPPPPSPAVSLVHHGYHPSPPVTFDQVVNGNLPAGAEYTDAGLGIKDPDGPYRPILIQARNIPLTIRVHWSSRGDNDFRADTTAFISLDMGTASTLATRDTRFHSDLSTHRKIKVYPQYDASFAINDTHSSWRDFQVWLYSFQHNLNAGPWIRDVKTPRFDAFNRNVPWYPFDPDVQEDGDWVRDGTIESIVLHVDKMIMALDCFAGGQEPGHISVRMLDAQASTVPVAYAAMNNQYGS